MNVRTLFQETWICCGYGMIRIVVVFGEAAEEDGWVRMIVDGRECAMREDGFSADRKGAKPVTKTLTSSEDSLFDCVLGVAGEGFSCG